ncbi:uncharacterized protein TNCT_490751 [Trichonephila clavata]|uniref:Alpha-latrotoxin n=1 Tax=Trichonephila clavata TaxID=2740835 RepID=A0A8X6GKK6_TRICU|nr:uncharacterized protein TNCT_490751 [Trichonephila clavata]
MGFLDNLDNAKKFEDKVMEAIDKHDARLVQILLGPRYCQLWQYWLIRAIFNHDILSVSRMTECEFPLAVTEKQLKALEGKSNIDYNEFRNIQEQEKKEYNEKVRVFYEHDRTSRIQNQENARLEAASFSGSILQRYEERNENCHVKSSIESAINTNLIEECAAMIEKVSIEHEERIKGANSVVDLRDALIKEKERLEDTKERLSSQLVKVKSDVIDKMRDGKFLDKAIVKSMYVRLLDYYLKNDNLKNSLLSEYVGKEQIAKELLLKNRYVESGFGEYIDHAIEKVKKETNKGKKEELLDIVRILAVNGAHSDTLQRVFISTDKQLRTLGLESIFTYMRKAHSALFSSDAEDDFTRFMSAVVGKDGKFSETADNIPIFTHTGDSFIKTVLKNLEELVEEMKKGGQDRGLLSHFWHLLGFSSNESKEGCKKIEVSYLAMATGDDTVMVDYAREIKEKKSRERNENVRKIYDLIYPIFEKYKNEECEGEAQNIEEWGNFWYHIRSIARNSFKLENVECEGLNHTSLWADVVNNVRSFINNVPEEFDRFRVGGRFTESFRDIGVDKLPGNSFVVWAKTTKAEIKTIDREEKEQLEEKSKQVEKRAEKANEVGAVFSEAVFDSDMDKNLKKVTIKSQVNITSAVVQHVIEYNSSPEQQDNVIRFLSSHKKHRIFGWEFGPTLLDHLYRIKKGGHPDYTKNGLILTYSIASVAALASFASTRKATVTAATTLGAILLGIAITAAIDYQKTKRKDNDEVVDQLQLLKLLGETPKYWWWPWSSKINEVTLTESQKERAEKYSSYSFLYRVILVLFTSVLTHRLILFQQNGGYMKSSLNHGSPTSGDKSQNLGVSLDGRTEETPQQQTTSSSNQQPTQHVWPSEKDSDLQAGPSGSTEQSGAMGGKESVNLLESAMVYNINLEQALHSLGFSLQILSDLDESLAHVRGLGHSEEAIKEYDSSFKEIFTKQYRQLALKFHPDKQDEETRDAQEMNNLNMMNQIMEKLYEVSKKKDSFRYTLFSKVAFNFLHQNRDKCSSFINGNVAAELRNITIWRQSHLLYSRNEFLKETQKLFDNHRIIKSFKKDFEKLVDLYIKSYCEHWISNLADLKYRCNKDENLKVIKGEIEKLLEDSIVQLMLLIKDCLKEANTELLVNNLSIENKEIKERLKRILQEPAQIAPDKCFILPVLVYSNIMKQLLDSYCYRERFSSDIPYFTNTFEKNINRGSAESSIKDYISRCSFDKLQELCKEENIQHDTTIMNFISNARYCTEYWKNQATEEEMKRVVLVQILNEYINRLKEEFKEEKTWFKRIDEEIQRIQEHIQETERKIEQEVQKAEQSAQKAEQSAQKAEQSAQKAEQETQRADKLELECTVMKLITQSIRRSKFDNELRYIVGDSEDDIVREVVQHVMNHKSSPEQVLDSIMQTIKHNEAQIKTKGIVDIELIQSAMEPFAAAVSEEQPQPRKNINEREESIESEARNFLDIFKYHQEQEVPLCSIALQESNQEAVEFLERRGASEVSIGFINQVDNHGRTLLHHAACEGRSEVVKFLVNNGANPRIKDTFGRQPIHIAAGEGHVDVVGLFLLEGEGIDINEVDQSSCTPLHYAAYYDKLEMVQFLIANGANIDAQAQNGVTPLYFAASRAHLDTAKFLVEKGANINMGLAIAQNRQDIIEFFNALLLIPNSSLEGVSTCSGNTGLQK